MKSSEYELNSNRFSTHPCTELNHSGLINNAAGRIHHIFGHNIQQVRTSFQRNVLPVAPQGVDMTLRRKACHHTVLVLDAQMSQTPHERTTEQPAAQHQLPNCRLLWLVRSFNSELPSGAQRTDVPVHVRAKDIAGAVSFRSCCLTTSAWLAWRMILRTSEKRRWYKASRQNRPHYHMIGYDITTKYKNSKLPDFLRLKVVASTFNAVALRSSATDSSWRSSPPKQPKQQVCKFRFRTCLHLLAHQVL